MEPRWTAQLLHIFLVVACLNSELCISSELPPCAPSAAEAGAGAGAALLTERFCRITRTTAWRHAFVLPEDLLARAYSIVGDDSRMRSFIRKLILGQPVQYAHLGGSVSVFALAKRKDFNWHAIFHRWLDLAFTPCGQQLPHLTARDPWQPYVSTLHVCPSSTITLVNHAIGATSCIFAEKCVVQRVNKTHTDWAMVEYTQNAIMGIGGESLNTPERRALERLLRKLLVLPSRPAVTLMHSYSINDRRDYGDLVEDWHNLVVQYYGTIQAVSVRSAAYDLLQQYNASRLKMYMGDGLHPAWFGHLLWADVMIYTFKRLAKEVMGDMLLDLVAPEVRAHQRGMPTAERDGLQVQLTTPFHAYFSTLAARGPDGLPPPLLPGNSENSDGFCFMGEQLLPLVRGSTGQAGTSPEGWDWVDESRVEGRHKWGYVSTTPGSKLVIELDTTIGGVLQDPNDRQEQGTAVGDEAQPPDPRRVVDSIVQMAIEQQAQQHGMDSNQVQTLQGLMQVSTTHAEVMLGYLSTYENVGSAKVSCISGCTCEEKVVKALWQQKYSTTGFLSMTVSAHTNCQILVEVLDDGSNGTTKFKVDGVILNARPYYWDGTSTATHYEFMVSDILNNMN